MKLFGIAAVLVALSGCVAVQPIIHDSTEFGVPEWRPVDSTTGQIADIEELEALAVQFPNSASVWLRLLTAGHGAQDGAVVRRAFERLVALGGGLSAGGRQVVSAYFEPDRWAELTAAMDASQAAIEESRVVATVPAEIDIVEGLAWDSRRNRLYATSVVERGLYVLDGESWIRVDLPAATGSLLGALYDPRRDMIWLVSGAADPTPMADTAFRGLIGHAPGSGETKMIAAPTEAAMSGDIALGPDGTVYVGNSLGGAIYHCAPPCDALETLIAPGTLRSPQGMAVSADGERLYVSDYAYGMAVIRLADGAVFRLGSEVPLLLDGIDGVMPYGNDLIVIRNAVRPAQIVQLRMSEDGYRIASAGILERNHSEWGEPTLGVVRDGEFLYVPDAQWERFGADGAPDPQVPARPTPIRLLGLD